MVEVTREIGGISITFKAELISDLIELIRRYDEEFEVDS